MTEYQKSAIIILVTYIIIILYSFLFGSCGHPERYGCNIGENSEYICVDGSSGFLPAGPRGTPGTAAEPCTVVNSDNGAIITCPDGSSVELFDGEDGEIIICHKAKHGHRVCTKSS